MRRKDRQAILANAFMFEDTIGAEGNMIFTGDKVYSYGRHFLLAVIDRPNRTIAINEDKYSTTTGKHRNVLKAEIPETFTVKELIA